ncbi:hypothetical protein MNBD_CHLOROFLEXI01-1322 [hydrothermal vent metagenome]|uniref:GxxExxY protein n=1 Tax=hydrothermal vent metagenome TaxID=652676 RepID=A0A3B0UFW4_9ZZZZ
MSKWLYEKEMEQVIGLVFQVRNEMRMGWSEEIYHQALVYLTEKSGIPTRSKPRRALIHRGVEIHTFEPDLIIWDKIILELKILFDYRSRKFPTIKQAQLIHYLNFYEMKLGALLNFAHPRVGIMRMIYEEPDLEINVDYVRMLPYVAESEKQILREAQRHIKRLARQYGLGYPERLYRKLIAVELGYQNIPCISDLNIPVTFEDHRIGTQSTPYLLIADRFLLHVRSSLEGISTHDFIKTRTYLKAMDLKVGWVVNFGRNQLQIHATTTK